MLAHGSSTPQNRVTESQILDQVATAFDIRDWPVVAVKAYVGHTIAPASGDQLATALGVFEYGILPGIKTIDKVADDVYRDRLKMGPEHVLVEPGSLEIAILNAKGFGGNNASAVVLSPSRTEAMLTIRYGEDAMANFREKRKTSEEKAANYFYRADRGNFTPVYRFGEETIDSDDIEIDRRRVQIKGQANPIPLPTVNQYGDMS